MSDSHVKSMFNDVRRGMKIAEDVAVFLIGGPGSGKDFIFKSVMEDFGLTEMNTDKAKALNILSQRDMKHTKNKHCH